MHLTDRQYLRDYMIQNRNRFREFIENNVEIFKYLFKMLLNGDCDGHTELVIFSEL